MGNEEVSMGFLIGTTRRMILKKVNEALAENKVPVTLEQFLFLFTIRGAGKSLTQQELANLTCKDKSAVLRTIDILEGKGLVTRQADVVDRRKNFIVLTEKCTELFGLLTAIERQTMEQLKEGISEEDYEVMVRVLYQIQKNANK